MYIHGARPDRRREEKFCWATGSGGIATVVCSGAKAFSGCGCSDDDGRGDSVSLSGSSVFRCPKRGIVSCTRARADQVMLGLVMLERAPGDPKGCRRRDGRWKMRTHRASSGEVIRDKFVGEQTHRGRRGDFDLALRARLGEPVSHFAVHIQGYDALRRADVVHTCRRLLRSGCSTGALEYWR
jgi:hypothetical protein